jgi:Tfp pilus assembly protein PilN
MRAVNLLPSEERGGRRRPPAAPLAVAGVGVLVASVLAAGFFSASGKVDERERELTAVERQLAAARRAAKPSKPTPRPGRTTERDQRLTALNDALAKRLAWDRVLRDVSLVLPDDVWLTSLRADAPEAAEAGSEAAEAGSEPTTPAAGRTLTFTGFTYSQESVARLLRRLGLSRELANVRLQQSSVTEVGREEIFGFTVLADVKTAGGTS